jgi:hypothetical protein
MGFVIGFILGIALLSLVLWIRSKGISVRWYEWLLGGVGVLFAVWAVHDYFASVAEHNEFAGLMLIWMIGVPAIIFLGLAVFLPWWRVHPRKAKGIEQTKDKKPRFKPSEADLAS